MGTMIVVEEVIDRCSKVGLPVIILILHNTLLVGGLLFTMYRLYKTSWQLNDAREIIADLNKQLRDNEKEKLT